MDKHTNNQPKQPLLSVDQAQKILLEAATPVTGTQQIPLLEAMDRVLAHAIRAPIDVPPYDNSSMDGYAVAVGSLKPGAEKCLRISQRIVAGSTASPLATGTAARIFTGAPIPAGADTVVMQEDCRVDGDKVYIQGSLPKGDFVRYRGEDITKDSVILATEQRLAPQHLGLAASVGLSKLPVRPRLRVCVLTTGDELVMPGQPLAPGHIFNTNLFTLVSLLRKLNCEVTQHDMVADTREATQRALLDASETADLILTSGGVSVGDEDHVKDCVETLGELRLWRIAVKPGKPLAFGNINGTSFMGLPGNPVSAFVTFCLFTAPFIKRCQGMHEVLPASIVARAHFAWPEAGTRQEYLRARRLENRDKEIVVDIYPQQSSGVLSSVSWADGLVCVPAGHTVAKGDYVDFIPFNEFGI